MIADRLEPKADAMVQNVDSEEEVERPWKSMLGGRERPALYSLKARGYTRNFRP